MKHKMAIICSGGGMRCAYAGGALVALAKELGLTSPEIIIAGSGSAGFSLYYLTQQYEAIRKIATELLSTPKFISYFRLSKIMDIDYLIDVVFKKQQALDTQKLSLVNSKYFIYIKNSESGNIHYVSSGDKIDIFETLRATTAIPFFYGKKVILNNQPYVDGSTSSSLKMMTKKAMDLGATKILVIDCRTIKSHLGEYDYEKVFIITNPSITSWLLTRNSKKLTRTFNVGYSDVATNVSLKSWLDA